MIKINRTLIKNGWNWISYKGISNVSIHDLLLSIDSSNNDVIKSQNVFSQYYSNVKNDSTFTEPFYSNPWIPLIYIEPGIGYKYLNHGPNKYITML